MLVIKSYHNSEGLEEDEEDEEEEGEHESKNHKEQVAH